MVGQPRCALVRTIIALMRSAPSETAIIATPSQVTAVVCPEMIRESPRTSKPTLNSGMPSHLIQGYAHVFLPSSQSRIADLTIRSLTSLDLCGRQWLDDAVTLAEWSRVAFHRVTDALPRVPDSAVIRGPG
jgi:hypothetical protein